MSIHDLSNKELYALCREYGKNARKWSRRFGFLLPEVARRHLYRRYRCTSIFEFAAKLAGMSHGVTARIVCLAKKLEDKPLIWEEFKRCGWGKLEIIARTVTTYNQDFWLDKLRKLPVKVLREYVRKWIENLDIDTQSSGLIQKNDNYNIADLGNAPGGLFSYNRPKTGGAHELVNETTGGEFSKTDKGCQDASCEAKTSNNPEAQNMMTANQVQHLRSQDAAIAGLNPSKKLKFCVDAETEFEFKKFKQAMEKEKKESLTMGETLKLLLEKVKELENSKSEKMADSDYSTGSGQTQLGSDSTNCDKSSNKHANYHRQIKFIAAFIRNRAISLIKKSGPVSRQIPQKIQKSIIATYNGMCAFSGCNEPYSELHHPDRFSLKKSHQRIYPLCRLHHQLAHSGLIKNEELTIENWQVDFEKNTAITGDRCAKLSGMEGIFSMYQTMEKKRVDQMVRDHWQA